MTPAISCDDYSRDLAKEGNVSKDNHFTMKDNFAKDSRLAFNLEGNITKSTIFRGGILTDEGNFPQGGQLDRCS
jgi:hypothetical protein